MKSLMTFYASQLNQSSKNPEPYNTKLRMTQFSRAIRHLNRDPGQSRVLDIGANRRTKFHDELSQMCLEAAILEPSESTDSGYRNLEDVPDNHFDLISMYHTLEHIIDPVQFLLEIRRLLKEGGHVLVEVPELMTLSAYPFEFDIPLHLSHFSVETLSRLFLMAGFVMEDMGVLDSSHPRGIFARYSMLPDIPKDAGGIPESHVALANKNMALAVAREVKRFITRYDDYQDKLMEEISTAHAEGRTSCIYGINNVTLGFVEKLRSTHSSILDGLTFVDDDPRKKRFLEPQRVRQPSEAVTELQDAKVVIICSDAYKEKIRSNIRVLDPMGFDNKTIKVLDHSVIGRY